MAQGRDAVGGTAGLCPELLKTEKSRKEMNHSLLTKVEIRLPPGNSLYSLYQSQPVLLEVSAYIAGHLLLVGDCGSGGC